MRINVNVLGFIAILIACFSLGMSIGNVINRETRYIINFSESDTELLFETLDEIVSQGMEDNITNFPKTLER